MKKRIGILLLSISLSQAMNQTTHNHELADKAENDMNKPTCMLRYIEIARQGKWLNDFSKTAIVNYKKITKIITVDQCTREIIALNRDDDIFEMQGNLASEHSAALLAKIESGNYIYNPHGFRYMTGFTGMILFGTKETEKAMAAINENYNIFLKRNNDNIDEYTRRWAAKEIKNALEYYMLYNIKHNEDTIRP